MQLQQQQQSAERTDCANHNHLVSSSSSSSPGGTIGCRATAFTDLSSSSPSTFRIAIIGLGPSGLSTALAIQKEWLHNSKDHQDFDNCTNNKKNLKKNSVSSCFLLSSAAAKGRTIVLDLYDKDDEPVAPSESPSSPSQSSLASEEKKEDQTTTTTATTTTRRGYGMTLTYNPQTGPLASLGVLEKVAQQDCPSKCHYIFNSQGHVLGYYGRYFMSQVCSSSSHSSTDCLFCKYEDMGEEEGGGGIGSTQRGSIRIQRHVLKFILYQTLIQRHSSYCNNTTTMDNEREKNQIHIYWNKKLHSYSYNTTTLVYTLYFENGTMSYANMIVGADGIHSTVLQQEEEEQRLVEAENRKKKKLNSTQIQVKEEEENIHTFSCSTLNKNGIQSFSSSTSSYLGVFLILGITQDFYHPLLDERGFYTVDGEHRLFTMPYEGSHIEDIESFGCIKLSSACNHISSLIPCQRRRRYMWQLSFRMDSYTEARIMAQLDSKSLLQVVQQRLQGWHTPIEDMLQSTPIETIWGTPLLDRNPTLLLQPILQSLSLQQQHVVVMGDAIHAMSPFKGQGCNQALMDGPLFTSWLQKSSSLTTALKGFTREMVQRSSKKVQDSRLAATFYHSPAVLSQINDFSGVVSDKIPYLLSTLKERGITAQCGIELDQKVAQVIQELKVLKKVECKKEGEKKVDGPRQGLITNIDPGIEVKLNDLCPDLSDPSRLPMYYCLIGDTENLRKLSLIDSDRIRCAVALNGMTCLHVAAKEGHYFTCRWLLSDYGLPYNSSDRYQQSPMHVAALGGNPKVIYLLFSISRGCDQCWLPDSYGRTPIDIISSFHPRLIPLILGECHRTKVQN